MRSVGVPQMLVLVSAAFLAVLSPTHSHGIHFPGPSRDQCPPSDGTVGVCVFDPTINCYSDSQCSRGQLCCNRGCGSQCTDIKRPKPTTGQCPPPDGTVTICIFDPRVNCLSDSACPPGQLCCSRGCGSQCVVAVPPKPTTGVCPPSDGRAGICVFDPEVNCVSDSECRSGELCCSRGCGKECMAAVPPKRVKRKCPPSDGRPGICVFDPLVNCLADRECFGDELCCSHGCGKRCVASIPNVPYY